MKQLLKIVLTSSGKLHGHDIAPRFASVHCCPCDSVCCTKSYKWHNVRLFVVGHLYKTDSWMVQFTEFLQRFMTKVSFISTHQRGTPMIILLFSTLLSLSPHSCRHEHRLMIGETWQWCWYNKHPVSVRVRGGRVPKRETCFLMVAGAGFVLGQQCLVVSRSRAIHQKNQ